MKKHILRILYILLILSFTIGLCSCNLLELYLDTSFVSKDTSADSNTNNNDKGLTISSVYINKDGELVILYTDGSSHNLGRVVGQDGSSGSGDNVNINISGSGTDASYATALGLRSAVSIQCQFNVSNEFGMLATASSAGSGVIYKIDRKTNSAFIITNYHVVFSENSISSNGIADDICVYLYGSEYSDMKIPATYVGGSSNYDIAVLRIDNCNYLSNNVFTEATFGNSDEIYVGQSAIAVGNPDGAGISATYGIISVYSEHISLNIDGVISIRVMRIDTPVNSGNSGGGLFNDKGELIGIVNAKSSNESLENIGYAIPSNIVKAVADNIIDHCYGTKYEKFQRAMLGITVQISDSSAYLTDDGHVKVKETVFISDVSSTGIAYGILKKNDVLVSAKINDKELIITRQHQLIDFLLNARVGDVLYLTVERNDKEITVEIPITKASISEY